MNAGKITNQFGKIHVPDYPIQQKKVTYDLARLMEEPSELKCSEFGTAVIENMKKK